MPRPAILRHVATAVIVAAATVTTAPAQDTKARPAARAATAASNPAGVDHQSIVKLITGTNPMIWMLGLCSVVTLGFGLERVVALRRGRVIPRDFVARFHERLAGGKLDRDRALELCKANDSAMARVFSHVVRYWGQPASAIRNAVEADAAGEVVDLKRNVRVLNATATIAPLLGLLGTVIGMIEAFNALGAKAGGAKSEALARGISLALVSTAFGLGIAILSVALYYYLLNRVDVLVRDLDEQARKAIELVSAESVRPAVDRRTTGYAGDHTRHETRIH
ncbi:MAG TPA: MotA/TolQ/ExbB proton channel family protein [Isosphaeraceae bacterium]